MEWLRQFQDRAYKEPIALVAVILAGISLFIDREWFHSLLRTHPTVAAYHVLQSNGTCPMVGFEVVNNGGKPAHNIRISILEDWITARGDEELLVMGPEDALIGPNEPTAMERRDPLDVPTLFQGNVLIIPVLHPGEHVQRWLNIAVSSHTTTARSMLANDPDHRTRPRIGQASYTNGVLSVARNGDCLDEA